MLEAINNTFDSKKELKILNFYWDTCPPCHSFMPIFIEAETRYGNDFDFVVVNVSHNQQLSEKYHVRSTPTIIVLQWEEIMYNKPWVPNGAELKTILLELSWHNQENFHKKSHCIEKKKRFFWLF